MHYVIGILLLLLGGLGYLYSEELTAHGKTKATLEQSVEALAVIQKSIEDMAAQQVKVSNENLKASLELKETKRQLDQLKGRESAYIAKPRLVEKLINKDFLKDEEELACLTGDTLVCR